MSALSYEHQSSNLVKLYAKAYNEQVPHFTIHDLQNCANVLELTGHILLR